MKMHVAFMAAMFCLFGANCISGLSQERFLNSSVVAGWSYNREGSSLDVNRRNLFSVLRLDHGSYVFDPSLISYRFKSSFSEGFEDFRRGQPDGSGFSFASDFLKSSPWPVSFSYSRYRRFSPTLFQGTDGRRNVYSNLGLGIRYLAPKRPHLSFKYNKIAGLSDLGNGPLWSSETDGRSLSFAGRYSIKGWDITGTAGNSERQNLAISEGGSDTLNYRATYLELSARRNLGQKTRFAVGATRNSRDTLFRSRQSNFGFSRIFGNLSSNIGNKFLLSVQGRYSTDSLMTTPASSNVADQDNPPALLPITGANWDASSILRYSIKPYLIFSGALRFARTDRTNRQFTSRGNRTLSANSGIALKKGGRYWMISGGYQLNLSRINSQAANSSESLGHSVYAGFGAGDPSIIRAVANYSFSRSRIEEGIFLGTKNNSQSISLDISKQAFGILLQARGGFQKRQTDTWNQLVDTFSRDFSIRMGIPRLQLSYSLQTGSGNAWQHIWLNPPITQGEVPDTRSTANFDDLGQSVAELAASGVQLRAHGHRIPDPAAALTRIADESQNPSEEISRTATDLDLLALFTGSSNSSTSITASFAVTSNIRVNGTWHIQRQTMDSRLLPSRFERQDLTLEWRFRQIAIEASYYVDRFNSDTQRLRRDAVIKITRYFRIF